MRLRFAGALSLAVALSLSQIPAGAQAGGAGAPASPAIPRARDGKPDLSGIWQASMSAANYDILPHAASKDVPAGQGIVEGDEIPYRPEALKKKQENYANRQTLDTEANCYLPGVPRITYMPFPFQIIQLPGQTTILYQYVHATRYIYTDGSPIPPGRSSGGWGIRAAVGRGTRSLST